jgi:uncharacterized RmlC-like cupin family protein
MAADERVRLIPASDRQEADPTPGMIREQAIRTDGMWAGFVRTEGHATSAWHHHGDHDTAIYVLDGGLRLESGPGGADVFDAHPGDFIHVPKGVIHRETNPGDDESHIVVVRAGSGPPTINVDGPAPS